MIVHCNHNLAAVVAVYYSHLVCGSKSLLAGKSAAGVYKSYKSVGYFDRYPRFDKYSFACVYAYAVAVKTRL